MAQYFRNASFTIAAIFATSGRDGLFSERNPLITSPLRINFEPLANRGPARTMYLCADTDAWQWMDVENSRWDAPLHTRGWVLQEEALSPRALEFGKRRISWNYLGSYWSELRPSGMRQPYRQAGDDLPIKLLIHSDPDLVYGRNRKYDAWYDVINKINHRDIKYQNDILPAISGIADSFLPVLNRNDRYLAGLWKHDLAVGLLWCTAAFHSGRSLRPLPDVNYITRDFWAPSWSWVFLSHKRVLIGLHETILYPGLAHNTGSPATGLTSASITLQNSLTPYGVVISGILTLLARCPRVTIFCNESVRVEDKIQRLEIPPYPINGRLFPKRIEVPNSHAFHRSPPQETTAGLISGDALLDDTEAYEVPPYVDLTPPPKRPTNIIPAIFLPLLNHSFEIGDQGCPIHEPGRTMGLLLQPIESHNSESRHQSYSTPSRITNSLRSNIEGRNVKSSQGQDPQGRSQHFYRRIGRGSLNMYENDWRTVIYHLRKLT